MFCAPRRRFESRTALETSLSAVNGGQTTISTSRTLASSIFNPLTSASASAAVLFIFQLPAMISFRSLFMEMLKSLRGKGRHPGKDLAFQKFQARAPAGAHKSHLVAQAGVVDRA